MDSKHKNRISISLTGRTLTEAHKQALRKPKSKTHKLSPEHVAKLEKGKKEYWAKWRAEVNMWS